MRLYPFLCFASLLVAAPAIAQVEESDASTAEVALSNDTLQLRFIGGRGEMGVVGDSQFMGTFFLSEDRDIVLSAGLLFPVALELGRLSVSVGPQVYAALLEDENSDVMSVSVGAQLSYLLSQRLGLAVSGQAFYAPDILTFGSADNLTDLSARAELRIASNVTAFGGMRWFEFDLAEGAGQRTLQEEVFVGIGYRF